MLIKDQQFPTLLELPLFRLSRMRSRPDVVPFGPWHPSLAHVRGAGIQKDEFGGVNCILALNSVAEPGELASASFGVYGLYGFMSVQVHE
jgi:hypothetical protein